MTDTCTVNFLFTFYLNKYFKIVSEYGNFISGTQYVFSETLFPVASEKSNLLLFIFFLAFFYTNQQRKENVGYKMTLVDM